MDYTRGGRAECKYLLGVVYIHIKREDEALRALADALLLRANLRADQIEHIERIGKKCQLCWNGSEWVDSSP